MPTLGEFGTAVGGLRTTDETVGRVGSRATVLGGVERPAVILFAVYDDLNVQLALQQTLSARVERQWR